MDISGVLPLPLPSSSSHWQKRVTAVTPTVQQLSDLIVLLIQLSKQRHWVTEQTIPSKTQPRTARKHFTRAAWSFCLTSTRSTCRHAPSLATTRQLRFTDCHVSPSVTSHCHVITCHLLTWPDRWLWLDLWLWPLTVDQVKIFQQDLSCSVFRVDSDFGLRFYIWGI